MSRLLRIVIFTILIAAIVFFGFRASQPVEKAPLADNPIIDAPTVETQTKEVTPPNLKDLSLDKKDEKDENNTKEEDVSDTEKEVKIDTHSKEKDK